MGVLFSYSILSLMNMMKIFYNILFFSCFTIISCSQERITVTDEEFLPYIDEFLVEAKQRGLTLEDEIAKVNIGFSSLDHDRAGQCNRWKSEILINRDYWERVDEIEKRRLIFHELGHCVLDRDHRNERTSSNECLSYMRGLENNFDCRFNNCSKVWEKYYIDELFDPSTKLPPWHQAATFYLDKVEDASFLLKENLLIDGGVAIVLFDSLSVYLDDASKLIVDISCKQPIEESFVLSFGNFIFSSCPTCEIGKVTINAGRAECFQLNQLPFSEALNQFSIVRDESWLKFYLNNEYIHVVEADLLSYDNDNVTVRVKRGEQLIVDYEIIVGD